MKTYETVLDLIKKGYAEVAKKEELEILLTEYRADKTRNKIQTRKHLPQILVLLDPTLIRHLDGSRELSTKWITAALSEALNIKVTPNRYDTALRNMAAFEVLEDTKELEDEASPEQAPLTSYVVFSASYTGTYKGLKFGIFPVDIPFSGHLTHHVPVDRVDGFINNPHRELFAGLKRWVDVSVDNFVITSLTRLGETNIPPSSNIEIVRVYQS